MKGYIWLMWRHFFPKKGTIAYVIKKTKNLKNFNGEITIKDGEVVIKLPPGKYSEPIPLMTGVCIQGTYPITTSEVPSDEKSSA